jgi:TPP-dependent indolepyruvate ferredoxin oxidoreductase alpha subunit
MQIKYSKHLENRLKLRRIAYDLPRRIFEQSIEKYFDEETEYYIAITEVNLYNKVREVMVAYDFEEDYVKLLTVHPLKEGQKENRIKSGRWRKI